MTTKTQKMTTKRWKITTKRCEMTTKRHNVLCYLLLPWLYIWVWKMSPPSMQCGPPFKTSCWQCSDLARGQFFRGLLNLTRTVLTRTWSAPKGTGIKALNFKKKVSFKLSVPLLSVYDNCLNGSQIIQPVIGLIWGLLYFDKQASN